MEYSIRNLASSCKTTETEFSEKSNQSSPTTTTTATSTTTYESTTIFDNNSSSSCDDIIDNNFETFDDYFTEDYVNLVTGGCRNNAFIFSYDYSDDQEDFLSPQPLPPPSPSSLLASSSPTTTTTTSYNNFEFQNIPYNQNIESNYKVDDFTCIRHLHKGHIFKAIKLNSKTSTFSVSNTILKVMKDIDTTSKIFYHELEILSRLHHVNIINIYGVGYLKSRNDTYLQLPMMSVECLCGETLSYHLSRKVKFGNKNNKSIIRPFSEQRCYRMAIDLASAMKYLHEQFHELYQIIHGNLNPDNIGFTIDGTLKIFDFGHSVYIKKNSTGYYDSIYHNIHMSDAYNNNNNNNNNNGNNYYNFNDDTTSNKNTDTQYNWRYSAPEIFMKNSPKNEKMDIYSFGMILYEITTGIKPFFDFDFDSFYNKVVVHHERPEFNISYKENEPYVNKHNIHLNSHMTHAHLNVHTHTTHTHKHKLTPTHAYTHTHMNAHMNAQIYTHSNEKENDNTRIHDSHYTDGNNRGQGRLEVGNELNNNNILIRSDLRRLIQACWCPFPSNRPSAMEVHDTLIHIRSANQLLLSSDTTSSSSSSNNGSSSSSNASSSDASNGSSNGGGSNSSTVTNGSQQVSGESHLQWEQGQTQIMGQQQGQRKAGGDYLPRIFDSLKNIKHSNCQSV
jgi:uncharacterized membrane protein YgcG